MELVYASIILVLSIIFIFFLQRGNKLRETDLKNEISRLSEDKDQLKNEQLDYVREVTELKGMLQSKEDLLKIQQIELANTRDQLNKDFQVLANQILGKNIAVYRCQQAEYGGYT